MDFSTEKEHANKSFIEINDKKMYFKNLSTKDIPIIRHIEKLLLQIADPNKNLELEDDYFYSQKAIENTDHKFFDIFDPGSKLEIIELAHDTELVKKNAKNGVKTLMFKLGQSFL